MSAEKLSPIDAEKWTELKGIAKHAELAVIVSQTRLDYFQRYLNEKYNMQDGDSVTPELDIVRGVNPVDKRELKQADAKIIVPG